MIEVASTGVSDVLANKDVSMERVQLQESIDVPCQIDLADLYNIERQRLLRRVRYLTRRISSGEWSFAARTNMRRRSQPAAAKQRDPSLMFVGMRT